jgi:hypothetical protein
MANTMTATDRGSLGRLGCCGHHTRRARTPRSSNPLRRSLSTAATWTVTQDHNGQMVSLPAVATDPFGYIPILAWLSVGAVTLAALEVQIEGPHGWAAALPTWRFGPPWLRAILNGKVLTGYHTFLWATLLVFFHLPLIIVGWSLALEATMLSAFATFAVLWDALWFFLNPSRLPRAQIWWFQRWIGPFPTDYYGSIILGALLALGRGALPEAGRSSVFGSIAPPVQHLLGWAGASVLAAALSGIMAIAIRPAVASRAAAAPSPGPVSRGDYTNEAVTTGVGDTAPGDNP